MAVRAAQPLALLYHTDETAWLEAMVGLIQAGRYEELDHLHLSEYLADMAWRDRRDGESRLTVLLAHLLKWAHQPDRRSAGWRATILEQHDELEGQASQGVLRNHAEAVLAHAYAKAVRRAQAETELPAETFPAECPYTLDQLLALGPLADLP